MITKNQTVYECDACLKKAIGSSAPDGWLVPGYSESITGFQRANHDSLYVEWHHRCFCSSACLGQFVTDSIIAQINKGNDTNDLPAEEAAA